MNTSANANQANLTTTSTARPTGIGFLRRSAAGALLAATITATAAVGLTAMSHADPCAPVLNTGTMAIAPAPMAPWLATFNRFGG